MEVGYCKLYLDAGYLAAFIIGPKQHIDPPGVRDEWPHSGETAAWQGIDPRDCKIMNLASIIK